MTEIIEATSATTDRDERLGLPSASGAAQWTLCPASHIAQQSLESDPFKRKEDALDGQFKHSLYEEWITGIETAIVPVPEEQEDRPLDDFEWLKSAIYLRNAVVTEHFGKRNSTSKNQTQHFSQIIEERLVLRDSETLDPIITGRPDEILIFDNGKKRTALIIDLKGGRGHVAEAHGNPQLATLAALLEDEVGNFSEIGVAIVQPLAVSEKRYTYAVIKRVDLLRMTPKLIDRAKQAMQPDQPFLAGRDQCKWCGFREAGKCDAARSTALVTVDELENFTLEKAVTDTLLDRIAHAQDVLGAIRDRVHEKALEQLETIPHSLGKWRRLNGRTTTTITDPAKAYEVIGQHLTGDAFPRACSVSLTKLAEAHAEQNKLSKREARAIVENALQDVIEKKTSAPFIQPK